MVVSLIQRLVVIFTSGSTGGPKAVIAHTRNLYYNALGSMRIFPLDRRSVAALVTAVHVGGLGVLFRRWSRRSCCCREPESGYHAMQFFSTKSRIFRCLNQLRRLLSEIDNRQLVQRRLKAVLIAAAGYRRN